jgi:ribosomal protein L40E
MMPEYIVSVAIKDASIETINLRGFCRVDFTFIAASLEEAAEEATKAYAKLGHIGYIRTADEEAKSRSPEKRRQLEEVAFYQPHSRNEEIYTYVVCSRCRAYSTHQQVWCGKCGSKLIQQKGRASELEKEGFEDGYSLVWYKQGGFFEVSVRLKSEVSVNLEDGSLEQLGLVMCRVPLGIKALRRREAVEKGSKYGEVYYCSFNRGDDRFKFFGIMIDEPKEPNAA